MTTLAEFVEQMPPDIQKEVKNSAEFLLEKRAKKKHEVPFLIGKEQLKI